MKYKKITHCRLCFSKKFETIIDFGSICLSSTFPYKKSKYSKITPMIFALCKKCKLPQLLHNYSLKDLYNEDYGYRSGINKTMINHLKGATNDIKKIIKFKNGDHILDIASNDGTLLKSYNKKKN